LLQEQAMMQAEEPSSDRVCLLGPRSVLTGDFSTTEELVILGQLDGQSVQSPNITIGPAAHVTADVYAGVLRIEGTVIGDVHAETSVVIHASATVRGSVNSPQLTIQEGANVEGAINEGPVSADAASTVEIHAAPLRSARRAR
jgi:cytoskeletal protein CcmA (bactofilin family)